MLAALVSEGASASPDRGALCEGESLDVRRGRWRRFEVGGRCFSLGVAVFEAENNVSPDRSPNG